MGERRSRFDGLLKREPRCIYCKAPATQVEHMPPRGMFRGKGRPKGLEFASCADCNNGTGPADLVASFIAKIDSEAGLDHWGLQENLRLKSAMELRAPGVLEEIFGRGNVQPELTRVNGILRSFVKFRLDGPLVRSHLNAFSAKLGMALYRQHVGQALPLEGMVLSLWFLNGGINSGIVDAALSILPMGDTLKQGEKTVSDQFAYRFNTDQRSILASFSAFHKGLYVLNIAAREPERMELSKWLFFETATLTPPGAFR